MGRHGGGSGGRGGRFTNILRKRIEQCEIKAPTLDQLVDFLRSTYSEYRRQPLPQLTRHVGDALQFIDSRKPKVTLEEHDDINNDETPPRKKIKKIDSTEERLKQIEAQHLKKFRASDNSSVNSPGSVSNDDDDDEEFSSDDRVYGEKYEPEFDLMKDMLRQNYIQKAKVTVEVKAKENTHELEIDNNTDNKVNKKLDLLNDRDGKRRKVEPRSRKRGGVSTGGDGYVGGNTGPMFKDIGGMSSIIEELIMEVIVPLCHPQVPHYLGVRPLSGILLHGPPGCGKTKLAHAMANETRVPFYKISATELVSGISGASEENIRELFDKAYRTAPSIIFIDEIDSIASKRENLQREMEKRIVTQLMTCMDDSNRHVQPNDKDKDKDSVTSDFKPRNILVIAATNRPDSLDPALRRPGRFDREIFLGLPDEAARIEILSKLTDKLKVDGAFDLLKIARSTSGFVGADLAALTHKAGNLAMKRVFDQRKTELSEQVVDGAEDWWRQPLSPEDMEKLSINMADFEEAAKLVQPSSRREGFSDIPDVKWEDVGGLSMLREEFNRHIINRIKFPDLYTALGVNLETGFLLYGPPGCGKTLIAKAVANEANARFIHVKGPELLNKYVGESELAVRTIFSRARLCAPCIIFFDEIDALTTKRGREGGWVVERLLNQLLIELDGADQRKGVFVIGATNRPEIMDPALLRPGRFGKLMYVPLPTPDERGLILEAVSRKKPIDPSVDLMTIAKDTACDNLSGADLAALMNDAAMAAVEDIQLSGDPKDGAPLTIKHLHFKRALENIAPSVSDKQRLHYQRLSESFKFTSS